MRYRTGIVFVLLVGGGLSVAFFVTQFKPAPRVRMVPAAPHPYPARQPSLPDTRVSRAVLTDLLTSEVSAVPSLQPTEDRTISSTPEIVTEPSESTAERDEVSVSEARADASELEVKSRTMYLVFDLLTFDGETPVARVVNSRTGHRSFVMVGDELNGMTVQSIGPDGIQLTYQQYAQQLPLVQQVDLVDEAPEPLTQEDLEARQLRYWELWGKQFAVRAEQAGHPPSSDPAAEAVRQRRQGYQDVVNQKLGQQSRNLLGQTRFSGGRNETSY